jgi:hypothetical protein
MNILQTLPDYQKKVESKTASKKTLPVKKTNTIPKKVETTSRPLIKTTSKSSSISKEDIVKIYRELIQKEFARLGIFLEDPDEEETAFGR